MTYNLNYSIIKIEYNGKETRATICNEETGEIFEGVARHNVQQDDCDIRMGANIALTRAIRQMVLTDLHDWKGAILDGCGHII